MRTFLKAFLLLFLFGLGLTAGGGYGHLQLEKTRTALEGEIQDLEQRGDALKRKYSEQKALVGQFMRTKARLEGQNRTLQKELEEIKAEKQSAQGTSSALRAEIEKKERTIASLNENITKFEQNLEEAQRKRKLEAATHQEALKQKEQERAELEREKEEIQAALERSRRENDWCRDRNAQLCMIANELVERYKNKGVGDALAQKEPFTQVKQVEFEKLVQEYQDRIDELRLKSR
jgi:chromosome segregation ATPase